MYLGYQNGKIKFYTEEYLNPNVYQLEKQVYTEDEYVLDDEEYVLKDEVWEEKQAQKEKERIAKLFLTGADVERGIYQAIGKDFDDIITMVENVIASDSEAIQIDLKALKIELKANNFYRGNPYVSAVGALLGFTVEQLDKFFEFNDYTYLLPPVEPEEPTVSEMEIVEEPVVDNSEGTTEENSVVEDIPQGEDVNNLEG